MATNAPKTKNVGSSDLVLGRKYSNFELDIKRIEQLVEETVNKLTFAMVIPQLVDNDYKVIQSNLNEGQLEKLKQVFDKYLPSEELWLAKETSHQSELSNLQSLKKIEEYFNSYSMRTENVPQRDEYDFSTAFHILFDNEEIKKISEEYNCSISEASFNFIQDVKYFLYISLDKMRLTPQEAEIKEAYLRKLCLHHQELTDEAHVLEQQTIQKIKNNKGMLKHKLNQVLLIKEKINLIIKDCEAFIQKSGHDADQQMIFDWKSSEHRQDELQQKVDKQLIDLEFLRKRYTEEEKELRVKRFKTEQHLISFLDQYDKDMQNRQNELDVQQENVRLERMQLNELEEKYNEQETIYNLLMEEKGDYEKRLFEAKLYEIKCSMAARKIQKFYRNVRRLIRISGKRDLLKSRKKRKK